MTSRLESRVARRQTLHARRLRMGRQALLIGIAAFALVLFVAGRDLFEMLPFQRSTIIVERVITGPGIGDNPRFVRPLSVGWGPDGAIYVSDTGNRRICKFTDDGRFLLEFGMDQTASASATSAAAPLVMPVGLGVAPNGTIYVADLKGGRVVVYDPEGKFVGAFKPEDVAEWRPTDVAINAGTVYVTDQNGVRLFRFDGAELGQLKANGKILELARPNGIVLGQDGTIYISETNRFRVLAVNGDKVQWSTGTGEEANRVFGLPRGIGVFSDGSVLVADAFSFCIVELNREGQVVQRWGSQGEEPGRFSYLNDVDVSGERVLVADKENHRVQILRLQRDLKR